MESLPALRQAVDKAVAAFPDNVLCRKLDAGRIEMADYHRLLATLFHQVRESSRSFAFAGALTDVADAPGWTYLLHHAEEEKTHWRWILSDLSATGYLGPDPKSTFPSPAAISYVAFNYYTALRKPIARLAIAACLESIGATHGKAYATKLCKALKLTPENASFFFGHGDTDVGHTREIYETLEQLALSRDDDAWLANAAATAGELYRRMYDEAGGAG